MKKPTQLQKLKLVGSIFSFSYDLVMGIGRLYKKGEITFIKGEWRGSNSYKNKPAFEYDFSKWVMNTDNWVTYAGLLSVHIEIKGNDILAHVTCDEGDMVYGKFKNERWKATFKLKAKHLKPFNSHLEHKLTAKAADIYEKELADEAKARIKKIKESFFQTTL